MLKADKADRESSWGEAGSVIKLLEESLRDDTRGCVVSVASRHWMPNQSQWCVVLEPQFVEVTQSEGLLFEERPRVVCPRFVCRYKERRASRSKISTEERVKTEERGKERGSSAKKERGRERRNKRKRRRRDMAANGKGDGKGMDPNGR